MSASGERSSPPRPLIVAHRGASFDAPENTLAAVRLAWAQGADAVELDLHATADGVIVCCHDATLLRTGGTDRRIDAMAWAELSEVDVGGWMSPAFAGERVPTLDAALAAIPPGKGAFLEIKAGVQTVAAIATAIRRSTVAIGRVRIISFDAAAIAAARDVLPGVRTSWLIENADRHSNAAIVATLRRINADGLGVKARRDAVTAARIERLRHHNVATHVWTVDDPTNARHYAGLGVASITTNRPARVRAALDTRNSNQNQGDRI